MKIENIPISKLVPSEYNPRKISKDQLEALKKSITEFDVVEPIVCNKDMTVIGGHQRLEALIRLGKTEAPCVFVDIPKDKERVLNLALNRIHGEWDEIKLGEIIDQLKDMPDLIELTGFDSAELDGIIKNFEGIATNESEDEVPSLPKKPKSVSGEIYSLGRHRLVCGSSTDPAYLKLLVSGSKIDMVFTDPPYNVDFKGQKYNPRAKDWDGIENDNLSTQDFKELLFTVFKNVLEYCNASASFYCWSASMQDGYNTLSALKTSGIHIQSQIVWVKNALVLGQADYQWCHEICWYGYLKGKVSHQWYGERNKTTVWEFAKDANSSYQHPNQKPTSLAEYAIQNSSKRGDIVLDVFGGSGSTLIAAEKTGRICYMMEIDPAYCDVIRERYENYVKSEKKETSAVA